MGQQTQLKQETMGRISDAKQRLMDAVLELIWSGSYGSTTIDHICEKAGVKKGSFYYFFASKSELAAEAFEESWKDRRAELDAIFSPTVPPLERLQKYCDFGYTFQCAIKKKHGHVLGCPQVSLGSEICTQEEALQKKIQEIMDQKRKYLESTIRDAHAAGVIDAPDAAAKARMLLAYYQGLLIQARIQNDVEVLREALGGMLTILGVKENEVVSV